MVIATSGHIRGNRKAENENLLVRTNHNSHSLCVSEHGRWFLLTNKLANRTIPTAVASDGDLRPPISSGLGGRAAKSNERKRGKNSVP